MKLSVAAVALALAACGNTAPEDAQQQLAGPPESDPVGAPCPARLDDGLPAEPRPVLPGALAARVCVYDTAVSADPPAPQPAVLRGAEAASLSDDLATAAPPPSDLACTDEMGPTAHVLLGYDDGTSRTAVVAMYGCGDVRLSTGAERYVVPSPAGQRVRQALGTAATRPRPAGPASSPAATSSTDPDTTVSAPAE